MRRICVSLLMLPGMFALIGEPAHAGVVDELAEQLKGAWSRTEYRDRPSGPDPSQEFIMTIEPQRGGKTGSMKITHQGQTYNCTYRLSETQTNSGPQPQITVEGRNPFHRNNITFTATLADDGSLTFESALTSFRGRMFTMLHVFKRHIAQDHIKTLAEALGEKRVVAWIDPLGKGLKGTSKTRTSSVLIAKNADQGQLKIRLEGGLYQVDRNGGENANVLIWLAPAQEATVMHTPESSGQTPPAVEPLAARIQVLVGRLGSKPARLQFNPHNPPVIAAPELTQQARVSLVEFLTQSGHKLPSGNAQGLLDAELHTALASEGTVAQSNDVQRAYIDWYRAQSR